MTQHDLPMKNSIAWRDKVVVVSGEHRGKEFIVTEIHRSGIWLRKDSARFAPAIGPFQPDQLEKID